MAMAGALELQAPVAGEKPRRLGFLRQLLRKKVASVALLIIVTFYFVGIFAPLLTPYNPNKGPFPLTAEERLAGPSADHWFGTDAQGRDLLTRVFFAARVTVLYTIVVTLTGGLVLSLGLGLLAGYRGGWVDTLIMRVGEVLSSMPTLVLMLALTAAFRPRITDFSFDLADNTPLNTDDARALVQFCVIVGAALPFAWIGGARIVRAQALTIRESTFVEAAEAIGASTWRVIVRHVLPGTMPLFWVGLSAGMAGVAFTEVALSFLGLGISPPTPSFGTLIQDGAGPRTFANNPHLLLAPSVPVALFFLAWNLLGDALVDILEPRASRAAR
jgi:peptide/nickel transport system permease protein